MFPFGWSNRLSPEPRLRAQTRSRSNLSIATLACSILANFFALASGVSFADDSPPPRVQEMCDFLGEQPAYGCKLIAAMEIKTPDRNQDQKMAFQFRLQRPSRLALIGDDGPTSLTIITDGKTLTQSFPALKRYVQSDAPATLQELSKGDATMAFMMLGPAGGVIPLGGQAYCDQLMNGVTDSELVGDEEVDGIACQRFDFKQDSFDWSLWIRKGDQPVPVKMSADLSKQAAGAGGLPAGVSFISTVSMKDWDFASKWTDKDFQFDPPTDSQKVDSLFEGLEGDGSTAPHVLIGQTAPLFEASDRNGKTVKLEEVMEGQVVVLDFWATWCGPCVDALPKVAEVTAKYKDKGVQFFAVNVNEDAETVEKFLEAQSLDIRVLFDEDGEISEAYSASAIPQTVIIGKSGVVEVVHVGASPRLEKQLADEIDQLLTGKSLAQETLEKAKEEQEQRDEKVNAFGTREVWKKEGRFSGVAVNRTNHSIFASEAGGGVSFFDVDGKKIGGLSDQTGSEIRLANLSDDDQPEVVSFQPWGAGVIAQTMAGKTLWKYEHGQGVDDVWAFDINADGYDEIIIGFNGSTGLHVLDHNGKLLWKDTNLGNVWHVTAGDVDQDGESEVISTSAQGQVHVFSAAGENIDNFEVPLYANMVRTLLPTDSKYKPQILVAGTVDRQGEGMLSIDSNGEKNFSLSLPALETKHVDDMAIDHETRLAAVAMRGGLVHIINLDDGKLIATTAPGGLRCSVAWLSSDEQSPQFVVATGNSLIAYELER